MLKQVLEAVTLNLILFISLVCTYTHASVICFPAVKYNSFSSGSFSSLFCFFWWTGFQSGNCFSVAWDPRSAATCFNFSFAAEVQSFSTVGPHLDSSQFSWRQLFIQSIQNSYSTVLTSDNPSIIFQFPQTFLTAAHYLPYAYTCSFLLSVQHLGHQIIWRAP